MPALFAGHGNPMNAVEDNEFSRAWTAMGRSMPRPKAILCVSAHWETTGVQVTAMDRPRTIYDFFGFPRALFDVKYPAPGSPALARLVQDIVPSGEPDLGWGLDHGAWSVLCRMFPAADIPVVQLSLDRTRDAAAHYALGQQLKALRRRGVLIVGSGNIVHNLGMMAWEDRAFDWAQAFDGKIKQLISTGDHDSIIRYEKLGENAALAIPTPEHFLPLLYILALREKGEKLEFFSEKVTLGSMSMRSVKVG